MFWCTVAYEFMFLDLVYYAFDPLFPPPIAFLVLFPPFFSSDFPLVYWGEKVLVAEAVYLEAKGLVFGESIYEPILKCY